jgi:hypothetical protein
LHESTRGGIDRLVVDLPSRVRKLTQKGPVRDELGVTRARFEAQMISKLDLALGRRDQSAHGGGYAKRIS